MGTSFGDILGSHHIDVGDNFGIRQHLEILAFSCHQIQILILVTSNMT